MKAVYLKCWVAWAMGFLSLTAKAQEYRIESVLSKSMAGISTCLSSRWEVFGNQAGIAWADKYPTAGIAYSSHFLMSELSEKLAFALFPVRQSVFAFSFFNYGYQVYNESKLGVAFAKQLTPDFSAGLQFNYFFLHLPENARSPGNFLIEGGVQYRLKHKLVFGMHCFNPLQVAVKTRDLKYKLPSVFRWGIGTQIASELWLYGELEKDLRFDLETTFGLEYRFLDGFRLRGGVAGNDRRYSMGLAYLVKKMSVDFAWEYTYRLGSTPSVALSYWFK